MRPRWTFLLLFLLTTGFQAFGIFLIDETEKVPIERLLVNFTKKYASNTNDLTAVYHLARIHSMAYATTAAEVDAAKNTGMPTYGYPGSDSGIPKEVVKRVNEQGKVKAQEHLTNAISFYQRGLRILRTDKELFRKDAYQQEAKLIPIQLGYAWCLDQVGQRDVALEEYRNALKISWAKEMGGGLNFRLWQANKLEDPKPLPRQNGVRSSRGHIGPSVGYSEEIIKYMKRLLDPAKDRAELVKLAAMGEDLNMTLRSVTPILIPLIGKFAFDELVNPRADVLFDLDGSGTSKKWGWITTNAAWLVYDKESIGRITSGLQMMGNVTFWIFWENGYQPLVALDDNGDGVVSGTELKGFALWLDRNSNGISESGEVRAVQEFGIISISTKHELHKAGIPWSPQGVTLTNGTTLPTYDWIVPGKLGN